LDNSSKIFLAERSTTVKDILLQCLQKCGVVEPTLILPYFGLFESKNGGSVDGALDMESTMRSVLDTWEDSGVAQTAKFLFMIRLFMPCLWGLQTKDVVAFRLNKPKSVISLDTYFAEADLVDVNCLHLQFIQAVFQLITGRYPTTPDQAIELGAVHFLYKFGEYRPESHKVGFLGNRIVEFIPVKHLKGATSLADWEGNLFSKVQSIAQIAMADNRNSANNGDDDEEDTGSVYDNTHHKTVYFRRNGKPLSAQRKYMELVYAMDSTYGCTFFRCNQHCSRALPDVVLLGIHHLGLSLFNKSKEFVRTFHIEDIFRWGFKPNQMFYFEIAEDSDLGTGSLEFDTVEGKVISDLLTDYAMAFLKEREREDERHELMKSGQFDVGSTRSKSNRMAGTDASSGYDNDDNKSSGGTVPAAPASSSYAAAAPTTTSTSGAPPPPPPPPPPAAGAPPRPPSIGTATAAGNLSAKLSKEEKAAIRIQALARGVVLRTDWAREDSAILLQSVWRGYKARVLLSKMIESMILEGELG
jgi:hypothetical protein